MTAAARGPQRRQVRYPAHEENVPQARHDVAKALHEWALPDLVASAEQIVSELVTNALEHSDAATIGVSITRIAAESVRIVITDNASALPTASRPGDENEHGRGLLIVAAFAARWGSERVHGGKRMWAEVSHVQ
ncbi:ATP-binding protein [Streptomyces sp. V1I1]|uniref:ATP-binding protein n=1 Tax=Streptomyces sp. V1I1 TaxID=3042272 RepID=UPI0027835143|nr:ATP-binding protein [Streptomyces sp. V1I1]MDQ0938400.1 anti-sigma regulatory factor (Ser/Thr protein kinase) [Streptomyces sp. V1I1]